MAQLAASIHYVVGGARPLPRWVHCAQRFLCLLGPPGSGKSSLLKLLSGRLRVNTKGSNLTMNGGVTYNGVDVSARGAPIAAAAAAWPQEGREGGRGTGPPPACELAAALTEALADSAPETGAGRRGLGAGVGWVAAGAGCPAWWLPHDGQPALA